MLQGTIFLHVTGSEVLFTLLDLITFFCAGTTGMPGTHIMNGSS